MASPPEAPTDAALLAFFLTYIHDACTDDICNPETGQVPAVAG